MSHGCTLFDFLVEVRGNDPGTSLDFRGCCHGLPWKLAGFHGKSHGSWRFHGKCHGCCNGTGHGSVRCKLRGTSHANERKAAALTTAITADIKPQLYPRSSAAICCHCHGNPAIHGSHHGNPRQLPRQFPRASNYKTFHGHSR